jgi:hypothetical protein
VPIHGTTRSILVQFERGGTLCDWRAEMAQIRGCITRSDGFFHHRAQENSVLDFVGYNYGIGLQPSPAAVNFFGPW